MADTTTARNPEDARAMAVAIQANLVQLKVADARRKGIPSQDHVLNVAPPGAVLQFRETLVSRDHLASYSDDALALRLHEVWGQYCLMKWAFHQQSDDASDSPGAIPADAEIRCSTSRQAKAEEVNAILWKLIFEQRRRFDPEFEGSAEFQSDLLIAEKIPAMIHGRAARLATDDELLAVACEYVGMIATARWLVDASLDWGAPEIRQPFRPAFD
ncbi:MAG: hypothetical protein ACYTHJ_00155 [Planctomycetota bacterium]|jgi:hypothetical protein